MANIASLLDLAAEAFGDRVAIGTRSAGVRFAELRDLACRVGASLEQGGDQIFAYLDESGPAVPIALFGAAWAGVAYSPINYRMPPQQQQALLSRLEVLNSVPKGGAGEWIKSVRDLDAALPSFVEDPGQPAVILFTSGTTSEPRAAVLQHANILSYILNSGDFMSAGRDEAALLAAPPFHIAGITAILSATYAGRRVVPLPRFSAEAWLAAVATEQVTHAFLVPTMLARIVAVLRAGRRTDISSLRIVSYGGARMPMPVIEQALELMPDVDFVNAYGLTETSSTVALLGPAEHRAAQVSSDPAIRVRLASVGQPLPGVEIRVINEQGADATPGQDGRIVIRGEQVSGDYLSESSHLDEAGWLATGDVGAFDQQGYLFVRGRLDDVIVVGGENVAPPEIEDCLLRHPVVTGAVVVGVPDLEWGELVAAAVTTSREVDPAELAGWVGARLGSLKAPKIVEICSELPMTPSGKLLRREVAALLRARGPNQ
jgi:acyl-CoA synthetase (AMP-forming)/AMP-acid ligase II